MTLINASSIDEELAALIDRWCERRALGPLRFLLPHYRRATILTDDWADLASCFKAIACRRAASLKRRSSSA